jgi:hypothetical protein
MTEPTRVDRLPFVALILPACFVVEVILGGPFGIYGGISVRFVLLAASCAVLLMAVLLRGRIEASQVAPILSIVGFLAVNGVWIAVVPVIASTNMYWSLREAHAFIVMVLAVLALALLRRDQLARVVPVLQQLVVITSVLLAVFQVGIWILGTLLGRMEWMVQLALNTIYAGAGDHLKVGPSPDGFYRVFWISTLWCVLSFFWTPVAFPESRLRWPIRALLLMDLFVAYSRGIWVGLLIGQAVVLLTVLTRRNFRRVLVRSTAIGMVAAAALFGVLAATGSLQRGVARFESTGSREDQSIESSRRRISCGSGTTIRSSGTGTVPTRTRWSVRRKPPTATNTWPMLCSPSSESSVCWAAVCSWQAGQPRRGRPAAGPRSRPARSWAAGSHCWLPT